MATRFGNNSWLAWLSSSKRSAVSGWPVMASSICCSSLQSWRGTRPGCRMWGRRRHCAAVVLAWGKHVGTARNSPSPDHSRTNARKETHNNSGDERPDRNDGQEPASTPWSAGPARRRHEPIARPDNAASPMQISAMHTTPLTNFNRGHRSFPAAHAWPGPPARRGRSSSAARAGPWRYTPCTHNCCWCARLCKSTHARSTHTHVHLTC
jgi:hypothetical protein